MHTEKAPALTLPSQTFRQPFKLQTTSDISASMQTSATRTLQLAMYQRTHRWWAAWISIPTVKTLLPVVVAVQYRDIAVSHALVVLPQMTAVQSRPVAEALAVHLLLRPLLHRLPLPLLHLAAPTQQVTVHP